jgi:SM-20-related protein
MAGHFDAQVLSRPFADCHRGANPLASHGDSMSSAFAILDSNALERAPLNTDPYQFVFASDVIRGDARAKVIADAPTVDSSGSIPLDRVAFGPGFKALIDDLESPAFREFVERKFGVDLSDCLTTVSVRGRLSRASDGYVHTDLAEKVISVLLYLNDGWSESGGAIRVLRSKNLDDCALEIRPLFGNMLVFRRSERSWHGHLPYEGPRLSLQFNWVSSLRRSRQFWRHKFNFLKSSLSVRR